LKLEIILTSLLVKGVLNILYVHKRRGNVKKRLSLLLVLLIVLNAINCAAVSVDTAKNSTTKENEFEIAEKAKEIKASYATDLNMMAKCLNNLGILAGTEKGYELERELTRAEGSTIVTRLSIANDHMLSEEINIPFTDVPDWAKVYVNHLYQKGAVSGVSDTLFGSNEKMTAQQFTTMVLRLLGYSDKNGDFVWDKSLDKALEIGMIDKENKERMEKSKVFTRGDMVLIAYNALFQPLKESEKLLIELQASTETARGLTSLFSVDLTDEEVAELRKPGRTWEDKFFGDDAEKFKAFEEKILTSVKQALDYYEVYYNGQKYDVDVVGLEYVSDMGGLGTLENVVICLKSLVNNESGYYLSFHYNLKENKLIPWSDEECRSGIAKPVVYSISLNKHGYAVGDVEITSQGDYVAENSLDVVYSLHVGKYSEKYLIPFDNSSYKIIIQDYK